MHPIDAELIKAQDDFAVQASALILELDRLDVTKLPVSIQVLLVNAQAAMERRDNGRRMAIAHARAGRKVEEMWREAAVAVQSERKGA